MKNKRKLLFSLFLLLVAGLLSFTIYTKADSGFDSDYDDDYSSSSSYDDYSSSYDDDYSSYDNDYSSSYDNDYSSSYNDGSSYSFNGTCPPEGCGTDLTAAEREAKRQARKDFYKNFFKEKRSYLFMGFMLLSISLVFFIISKLKKHRINDTFIIIFIILIFLLIPYLSLLLFNVFYSELSFLILLGLFLILVPLKVIYILLEVILIQPISKIVKRQKEYNRLFEENQFSSLNTIELQEELFNIYKDIQIAWSKNDLLPVRDKLTDELFNTYQFQIDSLILKKQRNVMDKIKFKQMNIINHDIKDNFETLRVVMRVTCKDYIVEGSNEKVVRGKKRYTMDYTYEMVFERYLERKITTCPNCGTALRNTMAEVCPSCSAVIVHESTNYCLSKKVMLIQRRR